MQGLFVLFGRIPRDILTKSSEQVRVMVLLRSQYTEVEIRMQSIKVWMLLLKVAIPNVR